MFQTLAGTLCKCVLVAMSLLTFHPIKHKLSRSTAFRIRNHKFLVKDVCRESRASCLLIDSTRCLSPVKASIALPRSIGLLQISIIVVSLTWSRTRVSSSLASSGRFVRAAIVVARRRVAVRLCWPTTWNGRFNFNRLKFGVASRTF